MATAAAASIRSSSNRTKAPRSGCSIETSRCSGTWAPSVANVLGSASPSGGPPAGSTARTCGSAASCSTSSSFGGNDSRTAAAAARSPSAVRGPSRSAPPDTARRCAAVASVPGCQLHGSIDSPPLKIHVKVNRPKTRPV